MWERPRAGAAPEVGESHRPVLGRRRHVEAGVLRSYPQAAGAVAEQGGRDPAGKALGVALIVPMREKCAGARVPLEHAFALDSDPECAVRVFGEARDPALYAGDDDERVAAPVQQAEPAVGTNPQSPLGVFVERRDAIRRQAQGILRVVPERRDRVAVVPVESLLGAKPEKALVILEDGLDRALRETLFHRKATEAKGRRLHGHRESPQQASSGKKRVCDPADTDPRVKQVPDDPQYRTHLRCPDSSPPDQSRTATGSLAGLEGRWHEEALRARRYRRWHPSCPALRRGRGYQRSSKASAANGLTPATN